MGFIKHFEDDTICNWQKMEYSDILNILNTSFYNFIRQNSCYPSQLLINPSDHEALELAIKGKLIGFNPDHAVATFRGREIIRSEDVKIGAPFFVATSTP